MTKLPFIAMTAIVAVAGLAAPAFAAVPSSVGKVPYCPNATSSLLDTQEDNLATQLQLSTKAGASIGESNGCLEVTTHENGKAVVAYYDPDTLNLISRQVS